MPSLRPAYLALVFVLGCPAEQHHAEHSGLHSGQGLPPPASAKPELEPIAVEPTAPTPPAPDSVPTEDLDEQKAALANVGRSAFDALKAGEFAALRTLTPLDEGPVRDACPELPLGDARELEAKFDHCHTSIDWDAIDEAQVFAPKPTGEPAAGCEMGIEDYGRLQLYLHMQDKTIWRIDFFGAVGADTKLLGLDGSLSCKQVDEAPPL